MSSSLELLRLKFTSRRLWEVNLTKKLLLTRAELKKVRMTQELARSFAVSPSTTLGTRRNTHVHPSMCPSRNSSNELLLIFKHTP